MHKRSIASLVAALLSLILLGAACSGGDDSGGGLFAGGNDAPSDDSFDPGGSSDDGDDDSSDSGSGSDAAAGKGGDACHLLSESDVEDVTGAAVDLQENAGADSCSYASDPTQATSEFIVVTVAVTSNLGGQDLKDFAELQAGVFGQDDAPEVEELSGVGDEAYGFDAGIAYILVIRIGDDFINLSVTGTDSAADAATELADIVVANA